jgi:hypothetical protein
MNHGECSTHALEKLRDDLNHLYKTVYQGNGTPSLVTQVAKLDHRIDAIENKLDDNFESIELEMSLKFKNVTDVVNEKFNYISYQITNEFERKRNESTGKWNFKTTTVAAGIAGFCSFLSILIAELIKRF